MVGAAFSRAKRGLSLSSGFDSLGCCWYLPREYGVVREFLTLYLVPYLSIDIHTKSQTHAHVKGKTLYI